MKTIFSILFVGFAVNAFAAPAKLICKKGERVTAVSTLENLNVENMFSNCEGQLFSGDDICFVGRRSEVIDIIDELDTNDVLGDEYRIKSVRYVGRDRISYIVWDGPNEWIASKVTISACKR